MYKTRLLTLALCCCGLAVVSSALADRTPSVPSLTFLERTYRLASFNQKSQPMWEFVSNHESVGDWTTLFTIVDHPDAHSTADLDTLSAGIKSDSESHGGKVLVATIMHDDNTGKVFHYMVVGFDQPDQQRYELRFEKAALGEANGYVAVYAVRITDKKDYGKKTRLYLHEHSSEVGTALAKAVLPDVAKLPRTEF
jgi:hypothetical protein